MEKKYVSLTFDDGPNFPGDNTMERMLDLLEKNGVVASFFLIGNKITDENIPLIKRAFKMGCDIQNHSWTHQDMTKMTAEEIAEEYKKTDDKIIEITGVRPTFFRPPYISVNQTMRDTIPTPFICGQGCEDWVPTVLAEERIRQCKEYTRDGILYLLHVNEQNVETYKTVEALIPWLKEQGYEFVTVEQMFQLKNVTKRKINDNWSYVE